MVDSVENYCRILTAGASLATLMVLVVSTIVALRQYKKKCALEQMEKDLELRAKIQDDPNYSYIQRLISHRNARLESLLNRINRSDEPCSAQLSSEGSLAAADERLRQGLDNYLNFLEGIGMLIRRGWFSDEVTSGCWDYYFERIGVWQPLREYICHPEFRWGDLARVATRFPVQLQPSIIAAVEPPTFVELPDAVALRPLDAC